MFPCAAAGAAEIVAATAVNHGTSRQSLSTVTSLALQQHLPANTLCSALAGPSNLGSSPGKFHPKPTCPALRNHATGPPDLGNSTRRRQAWPPSFDAARLCRRRGDIDPFKQQPKQRPSSRP